MSLSKDIITKEIDKILPEIIEFRHYLHANPELSLLEYKTSKLLRNKIRELDLELLEPFLETDVVALLNTDKQGRNITLRADIDALPILEDNTKPYCSKTKGVMHACGHDGHTAMLFGAAIILGKFKDHLNGSVRFVFQPGEEMVAGGKDLVEAGALKSPKPDAVLAMHGWPGFPLGTICSKPGEIMAAADHFKIVLKGKGGHGSTPEQTNDPILVATKIINSLYLIPTRKFSALDTLVINIGKIIAGESANVIPDKVEMEGTVRYFSKKIGKEIPEIFNKVLKAECAKNDISFDLKYEQPYIATINSKTIVDKCKLLVKENIGESTWIDMDKPVMSSEDFSYYIDKNPGAMFFLGMGNYSSKLHTNTYNFNDEALRNGIQFFVTTTINLLNKK